MTFSPSDLRSLLQAGTPRPWRTGNGKGAAAVKAKDCAIYINVRTCEVDECVKRWQEDARLIVAAVNSAEALLDENERLAAEVERAERYGSERFREAMEIQIKLIAATAEVERLRALCREVHDVALELGIVLSLNGVSLSSSHRDRIAAIKLEAGK
jgi:hypothetical protein